MRNGQQHIRTKKNRKRLFYLKSFILFLIVTFVASLYILYQRQVRDLNDPIKIIENKYDIDLQQFNYSIEFFEKETYPGGEGTCKIILNFKNFPKGSDSYLESKKFKSIPVVIEPFIFLPLISEVKEYRETTKSGYYLYSAGDERSFSFNFILFDLDNNKIIYLYQSI